MAHRPDYGAGVPLLQGQIGDSESQAQLMHNLEEQFQREERIEELLSLSVNQNKDIPERYDITLTYRPRGYGNEGQSVVLGV